MAISFWVWLAVIVVTFVIEVVTLELVSIWFSIGAIIPFILSIFPSVPVWIEIVVFVVVSLLCVLFLRKYAQKWLMKSSDGKTNINLYEGKVVRMLEDANFEKNGSIKVNDVTWTAVSQDGSLIKAGELVEIVNVDGNKFIVKKANENKERDSEKVGQEKIDIKEEVK